MNCPLDYNKISVDGATTITKILNRMELLQELDSSNDEPMLSI
jgi:Asp-tRNA(Asn)/Glu-tRNA(Gln) amidotransferase C subunit